MEQRKRDSEIPLGTFGVGQVSDADQRGDVSGTFLRLGSEIPPAPVARIELRRRAAVRPSMPALPTTSETRPAPPTPPALRVARSLPPPPPPAAFKSAAPTSEATAKVPTTTPEPMTLRALVAPSYPPPPPTLDDSERVDFSQVAQRLDVHALPPPPASLLAPPSTTRRPSRIWALALLVIGVGAGGWYARDIATIVVTKPAPSAVARPVIAEPAIAEPVIAEPVVAEPAIAEAIEEPAIEAPVVAEAVVTEPVIEEPVVAEPVIMEPVVAVEPTREVAASPAPKAAPMVAAQASARAATGEPTSLVVEPAAAAATEGEQLAGEPAPSIDNTIAEDLPETLERQEVIEGIELLRNEYQSCAGDMHGTAEVRLTIANTGRITHALVGGQFAGTPQGSCLARALRQARFRAFQQPRLDITYPIAL